MFINTLKKKGEEFSWLFAAAFGADGCFGAADAWYAVYSLAHEFAYVRYVFNFEGGDYVVVACHRASTVNALNLQYFFSSF